jgi:hypothetical protein
MILVQSELPKLTSQELLTGGYIPVADKFEELVWRSWVQPYCDYVLTFNEPKKCHGVSKKKNPLTLRKHRHKC